MVTKRKRECPYAAALVKVPSGQIVTFSDLADLAGKSFGRSSVSAANAVKRAKTNELPWWRVVYSGAGSVGENLQRGREEEQRVLLEREGVQVGAQRQPADVLKDLCEDAVIEPTGMHTHSLIYLHGFGANAQGYCVPSIFDNKRGSRANLRVVLPAAPKVPVTAYKGKRYTAWYDYLKENCDGEADEYDEISLAASRKKIFELIDAEVSKVGPENVFLGGTSQGCKTALDCYMRYTQQLGGFLGVVGMLLPTTPVDAEKEGVMRLWCGSKDDVIPWEVSKKSFERLGHVKDLRVQTAPVDHVGGIDIEDRWIQDFLKEVIP